MCVTEHNVSDSPLGQECNRSQLLFIADNNFELQSSDNCDYSQCQINIMYMFIQ